MILNLALFSHRLRYLKTICSRRHFFTLPVCIVSVGTLFFFWWPGLLCWLQWNLFFLFQVSQRNGLIYTLHQLMWQYLYTLFWYNHFFEIYYVSVYNLTNVRTNIGFPSWLSSPTFRWPFWKELNRTVKCFPSSFCSSYLSQLWLLKSHQKVI